MSRGHERKRELYSSLITEWRKQRDRGALEALNAKKRGPQTNRLAVEVKRLREQNARLSERLVTAEELIEAQGNAFSQKNVLAALGPCRHFPFDRLRASPPAAVWINQPLQQT